MTSSLSPPFATTRWSVVAAAGHGSSPEGQRALGELCATYWYPLYAYLRRRGLRTDEAQDVTQSFFAELLERDRLQRAEPQRGRFRSFLLASLNHFVANHWRRDRAQKRGGGSRPLSLDFAAGEAQYALEPTHDWTPERVFERRWALTVLDRSLSRLRAEYEQSDRLALFEALKAHLGGDDERTPYSELAEAAGMSPGALKVAAHRLRKRCRELLRQEIAETVATAEEVDEELRDLFRAVSLD